MTIFRAVSATLTRMTFSAFPTDRCIALCLYLQIVNCRTAKNFDLILKEPPTKSGVMREKNNYLFPDGKVWKITKKSVIDENEDEYTEYLAFDVTELYRRKQELEISNAEQQEIMNRMENIARNIVAITREEEILSMKMKIHNQLGFTLQSTRKFIVQGCPADKKEQLVAQQQKMAKTLLGERATPMKLTLMPR